jgi:retron-type reverse transcriptase
LKLQRELIGHTYKPGKSICFIVTKPKAREIFAADFRDRIVHHVLVSYLEPIFERKFIDQSYACRKGKGAHRTIFDLERYIGMVTKGKKEEAWYLQLDIQSFFVSLKKNILFEILKKQVKNPEVLWLAETIISYDPTCNYYRKSQLSLFDLIPDHKSLFKVAPGQGLPIGNLTSQFFANVYLNELDQFVKHTLKAKYYMRYVDDFVILSQDKNQLIKWRDEISSFLEGRLKLRLHPKKQILQKIANGIDFVGYVVKPSHTLIRRRVIRSLKEKLWELNKAKGEIPLSKEGLPPLEEMNKILSIVNSYYGQFKHAKTFGLRSKLWQRDFGHFNVRESFRLRQKV